MFNKYKNALLMYTPSGIVNIKGQSSEKHLSLLGDDIFQNSGHYSGDMKLLFYYLFYFRMSHFIVAIT